MVVVLADHRWHHGAKTHFILFGEKASTKPKQKEMQQRFGRGRLAAQPEHP
jgi:hypothetical protein